MRFSAFAKSARINQKYKPSNKPYQTQNQIKPPKRTRKWQILGYFYLLAHSSA